MIKICPIMSKPAQQMESGCCYRSDGFYLLKVLCLKDECELYNEVTRRCSFQVRL
jgi:hypothetical protein